MFAQVTVRALAAAALVAATLAPAWGHHGWRWTEEGNFQLTGIIVAAALGNPHGVLTVDVEGESWTVEVGSPGRNANAGLEDDMLAAGVEIMAIGHRSADADELRMKAERVYIDGVEYNLYPNRD